MLEAIPFLVVDLALFAFAVRRPWIGLVVVLAGLPVNGFLTQVVPVFLRLTPEAWITLGGWHDALVGGVVLAGILRWWRAGRPRPSLIEWLVGLMIAVGAVYVVVSPVPWAALYVFRVLYEAPLLLVAIMVLARLDGMPEWLPSHAARAFVGAATLSALFTWIQVYVLRFKYIQSFYTDPGQQIHHSFLATGIRQPRGIGLSHSPNEFGAILAIAILLLAAPTLLRLSRAKRAWVFVVLALAIILSFSRSGTLSALVGLVVLAWLSRETIGAPRNALKSLRNRALLRDVVPAGIAGVLALAVVVATSGAPTLVKATVSGAEPSAGGRVASAEAGISVLVEHPLGLGLGTAGPKAARFGLPPDAKRVLTETWYVLYAIQVGVFGFFVLVATAVALLRELIRARGMPVCRAALAIGLGLAAGAVFIPIIEEPSVWTPLWVFAALAVALATASPGIAPPDLDREPSTA